MKMIINKYYVKHDKHNIFQPAYVLRMKMHLGTMNMKHICAGDLVVLCVVVVGDAVVVVDDVVVAIGAFGSCCLESL